MPFIFTLVRFSIPLFAIMHMDTDAFVEELMERLNLRQTGILILKKKKHIATCWTDSIAIPVISRTV